MTRRKSNLLQIQFILGVSNLDDGSVHFRRRKCPISTTQLSNLVRYIQVTLPNLINQVVVKSHVRCLNLINEAYDSLIANCFHECKFYHFRSRLEYLIRTCSGDFFISPTHKARFDSVCRLQDIPVEKKSPTHLAVLFLITVDEKLWIVTKDHLYDNRFDFKKMNLSGINTSVFAIYQMVKTIYTAKEYIIRDEIVDIFL